MKKVILLSLMAILSSGTVCVGAEKKSNKATVVFNVPLHCQACVTKVEKNIAYEKGVMALDISLEKQQVKVTYNQTKTNKENLIAAFKKIDKPATEVTVSEGSAATSKDDSHTHE